MTSERKLKSLCTMGLEAKWCIPSSTCSHPLNLQIQQEQLVSSQSSGHLQRSTNCFFFRIHCSKKNSFFNLAESIPLLPPVLLLSLKLSFLCLCNRNQSDCVGHS